MIKDTKLLTDAELADIVCRASDEIECSDGYKHFLEDLAALVTKHFGGDVVYVNGPVDECEHEERYRCDNCEAVYIRHPDGEVGENGEFTPLEECKDLLMRLTPGSPVPDGECVKCEERAFVYREREIDTCWVAGIAHNECVPDGGWVYSDYDTDIDWSETKKDPQSG